MLITRLPPLSMVPPEVHGWLAVLITLVWCGELDAGERSSTPSARWRRRSRTCLVHDPTRACTSSSPKPPGRSPTSPTASRPTSWTRWRSRRSCSGWTSPACRRPRRSPRWSSGCSAVRSAGFRSTPPPSPTASANCSAPWWRPGSPRLTPTVTAGGCSPCRARSTISRRGRISTSSTLPTKLASTRPTRAAPIVVSSRSSGAMTRRTSSTATSTYDPPRAVLGAASLLMRTRTRPRRVRGSSGVAEARASVRGGRAGRRRRARRRGRDAEAGGGGPWSRGTAAPDR
jgi:hypothetical protein